MDKVEGGRKKAGSSASGVERRKLRGDKKWRRVEINKLQGKQEKKHNTHLKTFIN